MRWCVPAAVAGVVALALVGAVGCAALRLPNVPLKANGPEAAPPILAAFGDDPPVATLQDWESRRAPLLLKTFQTEIYGLPPALGPARVTQRKLIAQGAFGGAGRLEQWTIAMGEGAAAPRFNLALATPTAADGRVPVVIAQNFCGNAAALRKYDGVAGPLTPVPGACTSLWGWPVITAIFGSHSFAPPFEKLLERGYAVAIFYGGDVVADMTDPPVMDMAMGALTSMTAQAGAQTQRPGAIMVWAALFSKAVDALATDPALDPARMAVWGHSRNGKSALLAAAMDKRIAAVIALQPGTAGASLQRNGVGESVAQITATFPHWFAPAYAAYAGREADLPVDQHQLLALIAPRPVLIGGARRDAWSDPLGAYQAALGAAPVYDLYGVEGFDPATGVQAPNLDARIAHYIRSGLHGVHTEDWEVGMTFLDKWFSATP